MTIDPLGYLEGCREKEPTLMTAQDDKRELVTIDVDAEDWWVDPEQAPEMDDGDMRARGRVVLMFKSHDAVFAFMKKLIDRMIATDRPDIILNAVVDVYDTKSSRWLTSSDLTEGEVGVEGES